MSPGITTLEMQGISCQRCHTGFDLLTPRCGGDRCFALWLGGSVAALCNVLKLRAIYLALREFLPYLRGRHVLVRCDNKSAVYNVNHQGSAQSLQVAQQLLVWALPYFSILRVMYLPGPQNMVADFLSHQKPSSGEWRLHPEVVEAIWSKYGTAEVDLFPSESTTHCPLCQRRVQWDRMPWHIERYRSVPQCQ